MIYAIYEALKYFFLTTYLLLYLYIKVLVYVLVRAKIKKAMIDSIRAGKTLSVVRLKENL